MVCLPVVTIHLKGHAFSLSKKKKIATKEYIYNFCIFIVGASTVCFFYSVLFLKLWSYIQTNMWCRQTYYQKNPRERRPSITLAELSKLGYLSSPNIKYLSTIIRKWIFGWR